MSAPQRYRNYSSGSSGRERIPSDDARYLNVLRSTDGRRDERDRVQKKTFTKWVNKHLMKSQRHVTDLYEDLRDGHNLISLLEVLSGDTLVSQTTYVRHTGSPCASCSRPPLTPPYPWPATYPLLSPPPLPRTVNAIGQQQDQGSDYSLT